MYHCKFNVNCELRTENYLMTPTFKITSKQGKARAGIIKTSHGDVLTPAFFPAGTKATVKSLTPEQLREIGPQAILANTYHLHLQPGEDVVAKHGGIAKFMGWVDEDPPSSRLRRGKPTMTDSGGFQVFSLGIGIEKPGVKFLKESSSFSVSKLVSSNVKRQTIRAATTLDQTDEPVKPRLNKITEEGVEFQSHIDGSRHKLTPEISINIQEKLGADLIVGFDDLESATYDEARTRKSLELTNIWLLRSLKAHKRHDQLLYGVTHGGEFESLRKESAKFVDKHFNAIALGGAHRNKQNMYEVIEWTISELDEEKPRHQLGVGEVDDIFECIERGIDTFDCVIPTRLGRMGHVFVNPTIGNVRNRFRYDITKTKFATDLKPIDTNCSCYTCSNFTRAYVNHLFRSRELLAYTLATYHNVYFINSLTRQIRDSIINKKFTALKKAWI